jgi:hypothetical protein
MNKRLESTECKTELLKSLQFERRTWSTLRPVLCRVKLWRYDLLYGLVHRRLFKTKIKTAFWGQDWTPSLGKCRENGYWLLPHKKSLFLLGHRLSIAFPLGLRFGVLTFRLDQTFRVDFVWGRGLEYSFLLAGGLVYFFRWTRSLE